VDKMKGDYYKWKAGKKIWKAPWIINYYENITDENQYQLSRIIEKRLLLILTPILIILGILIGINL